MRTDMQANDSTVSFIFLQSRVNQYTDTHTHRAISPLSCLYINLSVSLYIACYCSSSMEPSRSASSPAVPNSAAQRRASFVSPSIPSSNFLYNVDFLNELQSPSVSSKLPRSPSTPGHAPNSGFNPDDFFASPPAAVAASASARRNVLNSLNSAPEGSTNGNTPQCKRRLFLESSGNNNNNTNNNNNSNSHTTPVRQVLASPAGSSGSFLTFGNLDTPGAITPSGKKRSRRFPSSDQVPPPFAIFSPHRNVLPPATSILMPSPRLFQTPKDDHSNESIIPSGAGTNASDPANVNVNGDIPLVTPKTLDRTLFHTPKDSIVPSAAASAAPMSMTMSMVNSAAAAASAIRLEEQGSGTHLRVKSNMKSTTRSAIFMTPITPVESGNTCRCKASRCLKLYCPCFAASGLCSGACSCKNCQNTTYTSKIIQEARNTVLQRDPKAFDPKVRPSKNTTASNILAGNAGDGKAIHSKGCNCRKGCSKNYCVCRELRVACGPRCTCSGPNGCLNGKDCGEDKCNGNTNGNGNINIAPLVAAANHDGNGNGGGPLRPPVLPPKTEPIVTVLKRVSTVPIDTLRANNDNNLSNGNGNTAGLFKHIRRQYQQQHAPLFPPVTPEKMKTDMLALASSPATRSPRVRSVARIQHGNNSNNIGGMNGSKINFNSHQIMMNSVSNININHMKTPMGSLQKKGNTRPPRILRVKMGSGRSLRKLAIGKQQTKTAPDYSV